MMRSTKKSGDFPIIRKYQAQPLHHLSATETSSTVFTNKVKASVELHHKSQQVSAGFATSPQIYAGKDIEQKVSTPVEQGKKSEKNQTNADEDNNTEMVTESVNNMTEDESLQNRLNVEIAKLETLSHPRILKGITHNPHFTPLQSYSKRAQEKLVVGWDEIFEEAIDQIQSLTTETFSTSVHELLKTIEELENLGYNVARMKKRVYELTDVMNKRNCSLTEVADLMSKAEDYRKEKKKIEKEIADLHVKADKAQVIVDELLDQVNKMEGSLPVVDALFKTMASNPI